MNVPENIREYLREAVDHPVTGSGKVIAHKIGIDRATLYRTMDGAASCMTVRRILRAYPELRQVQQLNESHA